MMHLLKAALRPEVYDLLYFKAESILKEANPCQIQNGTCLRGKPCCSGCGYLSPAGCITKALFCKLWLCKEARNIFPAVARKLDALWAIAKEYSLLRIRASKEESLALGNGWFK